MAVLLALLVVVRFYYGEDATEFVFETIDGFGCDDAVQAGHFVPLVYERFIRSR